MVVSHKPILFYVKYGNSTGLVGRRMRTIFSPSRSVHTTVIALPVFPNRPTLPAKWVYASTLFPFTCGPSGIPRIKTCVNPSKSIPRVVAVVPTSRVALSNVSSMLNLCAFTPNRRSSYTARFTGHEDGMTSNPSFGTSNAKHDAIASITLGLNGDGVFSYS